MASPDIDRGVTFRKSKDGSEVYMYKDDPGVYFDFHGVPVSDETAGAAGFDVTSERRAKMLKRREEEDRAERIRRVDAELAEESRDKAQHSKGMDVDGEKFVLEGNGKGRFDVYFEGRKLNDKMLLENDLVPFARAWLAKKTA